MKPRIQPRLWSIALAIWVALWVVEEVSRQVYFHPVTSFVPHVVFFALIANYILLAWRKLEGTIEGEQQRSRQTWRWIVLPAALLFTLSALIDPWPMKLRFELSRSALERKVAEINRGLPYDSGTQWIGLYPVISIISHENGYVGFVTGVSIIDRVGICYDPSKSPSHSFRIAECWYAVEW